MRSSDASALEILLVQALTTSDRLEYEQVGAHVATALDALQRESRRAPLPPCPPRRGQSQELPD